MAQANEGKKRMPSKFERLLDHGLKGVAWEYMRRSFAYKRAYKRAMGENPIHVPADESALAFGLKRLKDPKEWYFEGDPPKFSSLPMVRFRFDNIKTGRAKRRTVKLAEGQVALTFDLRAPVNLQLALARAQLEAQQALWVKGEDLSVRSRVTKANAAAIPDHVTCLRALDMDGKGSSASKICRKLIGAKASKKAEKDAGKVLLDRANASRDGDYRLLVLGALLGLDSVKKRKVSKRKRPSSKSTAK